MPPVTKVQCPTPGCGRMLDVKFTGRGRPSVYCKLADGGCGFQGFVNAGKGVAMWGDSAPAAAEEKPRKAPPPAKEIPAVPPPAPDSGRGFKFPFED